MKNTIKVFDIFVSKLVQKSGKILTRGELLDIWLLSGGSRTRLSYAITQVKNKDHITPLTRELVYIGQLLGSVEDIYWQMIAGLIKVYAPAGAIIGGEKSMEYHLKNYSIPDILVLYTRDIAQRIRLSTGREVHFRVLKSGEKTGMRNLYRIFEKHTLSGTIDSVTLRFLGFEASLLDAASLRIHETGVSEELFEKFLRQYEKRLSRESLGELVSYRYIRAANRLRSFSKERGFAHLYEQMLDVIKREGGGCFLNL